MNKYEIKKILIVAPNWIGDAVISIPAIMQVKEIFPSAHVTILGLPHISEIFRECPYINKIRTYHVKSQKSAVAVGFSLRSEKFDLSILFPNSFRSALIIRLAAIPLRSGYNRDGRGFLLNIPIDLDTKTKKLHQSEYYLNLVRSIRTYANGITNTHTHSLPFKGEGKGGGAIASKWLYISKNEMQQALETLYKNNIKPDDLIIGINPGAAYGSSKRWYPERFAHVARIVINKYNAKVIVFGGQNEIDIAEEIVKAAEIPLHNMAGKTSIRELMALISHCKIFITNDSGPMHIAAALGVPVVAIFGSTDPTITGPVGANHIIIKKDMSCSPCFLRKCPTDLRCMDIVSVDDVLEGVEKILDR